MQHSRAIRLTKARAIRRRRMAIAGAIALVAVAAFAAAAVYRTAQASDMGAPLVVESSAADTSASSTAQSLTAASKPVSFTAGDSARSSDTTLVEVPDIVGRKRSEAVAVLSAAGLSAEGASPSGSAPGDGADAEVVEQSPPFGQIVAVGAAVRLTTAAPTTKRVSAAALPAVVVCIDPGHQSRANNVQEPIGPGSTQTKAKVSGGATGVATHIPEYEIALQIAMNVKARLSKAGVKVVMTRTTNDVNLSNAQRAQIANRAKANLFLRIHMNGSPSARQAGLSTLYPAVTRWTKATSAPSRRAAVVIQQSALSATGAPSDGLHARSDLAGFNWCTRPSVLVECGYMSNRVEDRLLASPKYQDKVAAGITRGVLAYLGR